MARRLVGEAFVAGLVACYEHPDLPVMALRVLSAKWTQALRRFVDNSLTRFATARMKRSSCAKILASVASFPSI